MNKKQTVEKAFSLAKRGCYLDALALVEGEADLLARVSGSLAVSEPRRFLEWVEYLECVV